MASHVVVIASTARRATVKTTPQTHLSDVLEEACSKLGFNASQFGLKHNNKPVDLSRTIRLSGLSPGAKLELVQLSKSAGVVSVALQLPESEAQGVPNARLTDKFPSNTTLWLVLRKFEAGVAGGTGPNRNLTARGVPAINAGASGAGRLYYEQPILHIMNRELGSFVDLQKTLAQLGLNSGSALMRLSFRASDTPLEGAMEQIHKYFNSIDESSTSESAQPRSVDQTTPSLPSEPAQPVLTKPPEPAQPDSESAQPGGSSIVTAPDSKSSEPEPTSEVVHTSSGRPVSIYRPPSSTTPSAANMQHNEADYTPTVEHAQAHQKMLQQASRNVRLPTEAEIAAQAEAEAERLAAIKEVEIKIRFPDQSAISSKFSQTDTGADLYNFVRECLDNQFRNEVFFLRNPGVKGKGELVPDNPNQKLISDLLLRGRILVVFGWDDMKASLEARGAKSVLKAELRAKAVDVKVQDILQTVDNDNDPGIKVNTGKKEQKNEDGLEGKSRMPKWLKGLSKK